MTADLNACYLSEIDFLIYKILEFKVMKTKTKKGKIEINSERCKGCKYCILTCPNACIELSTEFNSSGYFPAHFINLENCSGCAMCAVVCPDVAITVYVEE